MLRDGRIETPAIADAKARAMDTDYWREWCQDAPDPTYWTHFLKWEDATAADWDKAVRLIEREAPEATSFLDHLRAMRTIARNREAWRAM